MASTESVVDSMVEDEDSASTDTVVDTTPVHDDLLQRLDELISPWKDVATKPEFTKDELVIIMVVQLGNPTIAEVQERIFRTFKYYNDMAIQAAVSNRAGGPSIESLMSFNYAVMEVFKKFDLPLIQTAPSDSLPPLPTVRLQRENLRFDEWGTQSRWMVHPAQARVYLQHKLGYRQDHRDRPFNFMRLPKEVRLLVYEELFAFPNSGIRIGRVNPLTWRNKSEAHVIARDLDEDFDHAKWQKYFHSHTVSQAGNRPPGPLEYNPHVLTCRPLKEILGIFLVSRAVYSESMHLFFQNNFVFESLDSLNFFLRRTPRKRRDMIRHITFFYKGRMISERLCEMRKLKTLDIVLNEKDYFRDEYEDLTRRYDPFDLTQAPPGYASLRKRSSLDRRSDVHKIPGMSVLKTMRLETATFHGNCDVAKEEIQPLMEKKMVTEAGDAEWLDRS